MFYVFVYLFIHLYIYIYIYVYTYIHTHVYIYIYMIRNIPYVSIMYPFSRPADAGARLLGASPPRCSESLRGLSVLRGPLCLGERNPKKLHFDQKSSLGQNNKHKILLRETGHISHHVRSDKKDTPDRTRRDQIRPDSVGPCRIENRQASRAFGSAAGNSPGRAARMRKSPGPPRGAPGRPRARGALGTANLCTIILDFRGFDQSIILSLRGGIPRPIGNFP